MIALIDYGAGNVRSVEKALQAVGAEVQITGEPRALHKASKIVLPGVGAFGDCMAGLHRAGLASALQQAVQEGKPLLGICVGLQVLFDEGEEQGMHPGLGLLPGRVVRFRHQPANPWLKVPHTGWNQIEPVASSPLLEGLAPGAWAYFNHAYYGEASPTHTLALTSYGRPFPSVVGLGSIYGVQFHPEKSQRTGLQTLRNFAERVT